MSLEGGKPGRWFGEEEEEERGRRVADGEERDKSRGEICVSSPLLTRGRDESEKVLSALLLRLASAFFASERAKSCF